MSFMPKLFIGIGETGAYFTLRETYEHIRYVDGHAHVEVRSFHHFNLSQNGEEAYDKASSYAEAMDLPFTCNKENIMQEMREIERMTQQQQEERKEKIRRAEAQAEEDRKARLEEFKEVLAKGVFPFGRYVGDSFYDVPRGYISWLIDNADVFDEESPMKMVSQAVKEQASDRAWPKADKDKFVGKEKQRLVFDVTVTSVITKFVESYSGFGGPQAMHVVTMVTSDNELLTSFGAFFPEEGDEVKIKATVKKHQRYNDCAQTVVNRVKVQ